MTDLDDASDKLLDALPPSARRAHVEPVLRAATLALKGLARLDTLLFERRTQSGALVVDVLARTPRGGDDDAAAKLHERAEKFLGSAAAKMWRGALAFVRVVHAELGAHMSQAEDSELDFDFGFGEQKTNPGLDTASEQEIEDALDNLDDDDDEVNLAEVADATVPLVNALHTELKSAKAQLDEALASHQFGQAVQVLDRTRDGLEEAIFAVVEGVFTILKAPLSRSEMVPGYRSALDEALSLRLAIVHLHRGVARENDALGRGDRSGLNGIRARLNFFLESRDFTIMRPADRMQMLEFRRDFDKDGNKEQLAEGLAKYLESLTAINQREVIQQHDRRIARSIDEHLESARSLFEVSPKAAIDQLLDAFLKATLLEGRRGDLDELLMRWSVRKARVPRVEQARVWLEELEPFTNI